MEDERIFGLPEKAEVRPEGPSEESIAGLVRDRLDRIGGMRALDSSHDDVRWWQKRTRMVLEAVVSRNRKLKGVLSAFDSLSFGSSSLESGTPDTRASYGADLAKAENLLRNLLRELEEGPPAAAGTGTNNSIPVSEEAGKEPAPALDDEPGDGKVPVGPTSCCAPAPCVTSEAMGALLRLAEAVERDPGLSTAERHDFRLDVRSLQNEMMKHSPDARRVLDLLSVLGRFEVDLSAVRRMM